MIKFTKSKISKWKIGYGRLAKVSFSEGENLKICNLRDFSYPDKKEENPATNWIDIDLNLGNLSKTILYIVPFMTRGIAHLMVGFVFGDETIVVSPELRYKKGQSFSVLDAIIKNNQLCYLWGRKEDLVFLRKNIRKGEDVFQWSLPISKKQSQRLFKSFVDRANKINHISPERYNLITNSCSKNILSHLEHIGLSFGWLRRLFYIMFPANLRRFVDKAIGNSSFGESVLAGPEDIKLNILKQ